MMLIQVLRPFDPRENGPIIEVPPRANTDRPVSSHDE